MTFVVKFQQRELNEYYSNINSNLKIRAQKLNKCKPIIWLNKSESIGKVCEILDVAVIYKAKCYIIGHFLSYQKHWLEFLKYKKAEKRNWNLFKLKASNLYHIIMHNPVNIILQLKEIAHSFLKVLMHLLHVMCT